MNENFKELLHLYYLENITNIKKQDKEGWYLITDLDESSSKFVVGGNKESFKEFYKDLLDLGLIIKSEDSKKIKFTEKYKVYGDFIHTKRTREEKLYKAELRNYWAGTITLIFIIVNTGFSIASYFTTMKISVEQIDKLALEVQSLRLQSQSYKSAYSTQSEPLFR